MVRGEAFRLWSRARGAVSNPTASVQYALRVAEMHPEDELLKQEDGDVYDDDDRDSVGSY